MLIREENNMAKIKTAGGNVDVTEDNLKDLGVGDVDMLAFENPKAHDFEKFAYRKVNIKRVAYFKMKKYGAEES